VYEGNIARNILGGNLVWSDDLDKGQQGYQNKNDSFEHEEVICGGKLT
jgi:hypothetical protein